MTKLIFVSLKSFGDLVIPATVLGSLAPSAREQVSILAGSHLRPLVDALAFKLQVDFIQTGEKDVPALFDIKKRGKLAAVRSLFRLRRAVHRTGRSPAGLFVVDRVGLREKLLLGLDAHPLPEAANIYLAYADCLNAFGFSPEHSKTSERSGSRTVAVFPGSRIAQKNMPRPLVIMLLGLCAELGWQTKLQLLDGERPDLEDLPEAIIVPRDFGAMAAAAREADAVLSADSMPAHMAEHAGRPVFVLSPADNRYWLPLSAFRHDRWAKFDDQDIAGSVSSFLESAVASSRSAQV